MRKKSAREMCKGASSGLECGWNQALADLETEVEKAKQRISTLNRSIKIVKHKIASGEPLPIGIQIPTQN